MHKKINSLTQYFMLNVSAIYMIKENAEKKNHK